MKTKIILATLLLSGCQANVVPQEPQPKDLQWFQEDCALYGAFTFDNSDKSLVFQVPIDTCARGA
jgi:hypothetical protein